LGIKNHWAAVVRVGGGARRVRPLVPLVFTTWQAIPFKRKFYDVFYMYLGHGIKRNLMFHFSDV